MNARLAKPAICVSTTTPAPEAIQNRDGKTPMSNGKPPVRQAGNNTFIEDTLRRVIREESSRQPIFSKLTVVAIACAILATVWAVLATIGYIRATENSAPKTSANIPNAVPAPNGSPVTQKTPDGDGATKKEVAVAKKASDAVPGELSQKAPDTQDYCNIELKARKHYVGGHFREYRIIVSGQITNENNQFKLVRERHLDSSMIVGIITKNNIKKAVFDIDCTNVMGGDIVLRDAATNQEICRLEIPPPGPLRDIRSSGPSAPGGGNIVIRLPE